MRIPSSPILPALEIGMAPPPRIEKKTERVENGCAAVENMDGVEVVKMHAGLSEALADPESRRGELMSIDAYENFQVGLQVFSYA